MNKLNLVRAGLPQTVEPAPTEELSDDELLDKCRITPRTELPPMEHFFTMHGKPCFFRGELTANCGKAKSGKTLFLSILMACSIRKQPDPTDETTLGELPDGEGQTAETPEGESLTVEMPEDESLTVVMPEDESQTAETPTGEASARVLALQRVSDNPIRVLWIDTEQSAQSTQEIQIKRIMPLAGATDLDDDRFFAFNLRGLGYKKRGELIEKAIRRCKPDLVIIDGIKDLLTDINDAVQASLIMEQVMAWAQTYKCCIVNVLHQNKSDADHNMRGSIGTELTNKAFEVFRCEYIEETDVFTVKHVMSRKSRLRRKMYYRLDDDGMPTECAPSAAQTSNDQGRFTSKKPQQTVTPDTKWEAFNQKYIIRDETADTYAWNLQLLFEDAFEGREFRPFGQVMAAALRLSHIQDAKLYYALVEQAKKQSVVSQVTHPKTGDAYLKLIQNELPF